MIYPQRGYGASVIVVRGGVVLAISRGADLSDWGLPGGKVDPGESFETAALRELWEETGVDGRGGRLLPVVERYEPRTHAKIFFLEGPVAFPPLLQSRPFEGYVAWKRPEDLLCANCRHRRYNKLAFSRLGLI